MKNQTIAFILINYFNEKEVVNFITNQLNPESHQFIKIVIVDNGSNDRSILEGLTIKFENVSLLKSPSNIGYFKGADLGLSFIKNQTKELPNYLILCNTDIEFNGEEFYRILPDTEGDIIGPSVFSTKSRLNQNPYLKNRISKSKLQFLKLVFSFQPFYLAYQSISIIKNYGLKLIKITPIACKQNVYAIHGSFMIFNKNFFSKGGTFNYGSFLYGEELFIAEIARCNGMTTIYNPDLKVTHHEHSTTGTFKTPTHTKFMKQSIDYVTKTFFN